MKFSKSAPSRGPSSSIGILNFFDAKLEGPQVSPSFIFAAVIVFSVIIIALHLL
jgi:preprotein translocase subunit Sec61beta